MDKKILFLLIIFGLVLCLFYIIPIDKYTDKYNDDKYNSKENEKPMIKKLNYDENERNYITIYFQDSNKTIIYVHGGGFIGGSVSNKKSKEIITYFLNKGYNVVAVEYRTCHEASFKDVIKDINKGVIFSTNKLNKIKKQDEVIYVGYSAGATAGALILRGDNNLTFNGIDKYILLSGIYNPNNLGNPCNKTLNICGKEMLRFFKYDDKKQPQHINVLLMEGCEDAFDNLPKTDKSHLEFFKDILNKGEGNNITSIWVDGGHDAPLKELLNENNEIINFLNK